MVRQVNADFFFSAIGVFYADKGGIAGNAFGIAFADDFIIVAVDVKQLVFQGR